MRTSLRHPGLVIAGIAAAAILITAAAFGSGRHDGTDGNGSQGNPTVIPPNANPLGKSYGEWGAAWWQWALINPCATNVISDPDGSHGADNQAGPVWYLAGGSPHATRTLAVPAGKFLFFPLINVINDYPCPDPTFQPPPGQSLEDWLTAGARFYMDATTALECDVDGQSLGNLFNYRATSRLFSFHANPDLASCFDPCILPAGNVGVSDGFWLMLTPLNVGAHAVHFHASNTVFGDQDMTYHLTIGGQGSAPQLDRATAAQHSTWGQLKTIYR